jgi:hypothetical protein
MAKYSPSGSPPDVTACIFWLTRHWRGSQQMEHVLGKYIISDTPMTEEERAQERATVLDAEPAFGDGPQFSQGQIGLWPHRRLAAVRLQRSDYREIIGS